RGRSDRVWWMERKGPPATCGAPGTASGRWEQVQGTGNHGLCPRRRSSELLLRRREQHLPALDFQHQLQVGTIPAGRAAVVVDVEDLKAGHERDQVLHGGDVARTDPVFRDVMAAPGDACRYPLDVKLRTGQPDEPDLYLVDVAGFPQQAWDRVGTERCLESVVGAPCNG